MRVTGLRRAALVALLIAILSAFYGSTYDFREVTDNRANSLSTAALVKHGDLDVSRYSYPRKTFVRPHGAQRYSVYGAGVSLVAAPIYAVGVRLARSEAVRQGLVAVPYTAAAAVAMLLLLLRLFDDRKLAVTGAIVFAFGTTIWPLAAMAFYSHAMVALFAIVGLMGLFSRARSGPVVAGLGFGAALMVRPSMIAFVVPLGVLYLVAERRDLWRFALGLVPGVVEIAVQNRWLWGSWTTNGYSLLGIGFHGNLTHALWELTFGWWRGIFVYSPVLLLALAGFVLALRTPRGFAERRMIALFAGFVLSLLAYARFTTWWAGLAQFGYRYLLDDVPALVVLAAYAVRRIERLMVPALGVAALSVFTMTFGSIQKYGAFDNNLFASSFTSASIGQAWIVAVHEPLGPLLRLCGIAAIGVILWWAAGRLRPAAPPQGLAGP